MGRNDEDNDLPNAPGSSTPSFDAEPTDSSNPEADLDTELSGAMPTDTGEVPDLSPTYTPDRLDPMSDQQAIDQALAEGPAAPATRAPGIPQAQAPAPAQGNPSNVLGNFDQGVQDETHAREEVARLEGEERQRQADAMDRQAQIKREQLVQKQMDDLADQEARDKVVALQRQAEADVANHKFHDFMSTRTKGQKLALIIGAGLAGHAGHGKDYNANVQSMIAQDFAQQRAELSSKENLVRMRKEGVTDFDQHLRDQRARIALKEASALDAAATEAQAQALRTGNPLVKARADQLSAQLTQSAAIKRQDLQNKVYQGELEQSRARMLDAKAAKARAAASGGSGSNGKLQSLTEALQKSGGEITPDVAAVADRLKIKRADLTSMAGSFKAERTKDLADRKGVNAEVGAFAKDAQLPEITKRHQALNKINNLLNNPNVDPLTQVMALMEFDKAAKGGTATAASMQAALSHLAGGTDKVGQLIEKVKSGGLSEEQLNNLRTSVHEALGQTKEEANEVHEAFNQTFRNTDSYPDQKAIDRVADQHFGALGYSRKPKAEAKPETKAEPKAETPKPPSLSKAEAFELKKYINASKPGDAKADQARDLLKASGY